MDAYQYWLTTPEAQAQRQAFINAGPEAAGYTLDSYREDPYGQTVAAKAKLVDYAGEGSGRLEYWDPNSYQPPNPYQQDLNSGNYHSLEAASLAGLFGSTDYNFLQNLRQTYGGLGKSDDQILQAAKDAYAWHGQQFNQGYTPASDWGNINNKIAQNLGLSEFGGADQNFHNLGGGFTADAAQARGNYDRNKNYSGTFGQDNLLSSVASYEADRFGDIGHAYRQDPERPLLGINTPFESKLWGGITGKDYNPTVDMYGGDTKTQQQNYAQKGGDPTAGAMGHTAARTTVGAMFGQAGYGWANSAIGSGNQVQNGNTNWGAMLPALGSAALSAYGNFGGGNNISGESGTNTLYGDIGKDTTLGGNKNMGDWQFDDYSGQWINTADPYGTGVDMYGNPTGQYANYGSPNVSYADQTGGFSLDSGSGLGGGGLSLGDLWNYGKSAYGFIKENKGLLGGLLGAAAGAANGAKPGGTVTSEQGPWGPQQPYLQALFPSATANMMDTLNGRYLTPDSNPYLKSYGQALADQVGANVDSRFSAAGRYGSAAHAGEVAKQIGNTLAGLYGTAYTNERAMQSNNASGLLSRNFGGVTTQPYFVNPLGGALSGAAAGAAVGRAW